jgi:hypothetical protein
MPQNSNTMLDQKSRGYNGMVLRPADLPLNHLNAHTTEQYYISEISEMELNSIQCAVSYIFELDAAINIHLFIYLFKYTFI